MDGTSHPAVAIPTNDTVQRATTKPFPWPEMLLALAVTSMAVGVLWDISWHISIGRDTFWTAAHMAIYFGGTLAGCVGGWLAIKNTFLTPRDTATATVNILGARAPVGAWVAIWGAIAMLTSGPFDDWWHNAYGLDVKIISPPHVVLGLGMLGISVAALLQALSLQNRDESGPGGAIFVFSGGIFLVLGAVFISEFTHANLQHAVRFYSVTGAVITLRLVTVGRAGKVAWPATSAALVYLLVMCLMMWLLPLFPAQPKLAPIFNPVTHMVPPAFPLLIVVPALGIDLFLRKFGERDRGGLKRVAFAVVLALIFIVLFLPTQWFFSEFLLSPGADNWFFAGNRFWGYGTQPGHWRQEFWYHDPATGAPDYLTVKTVLRILLWTTLSAWLGLLWGGWMRKVKR